MIYAKFINFPIFNVADAAICIAIALLVFEAFFKKVGVFEVFEDEYRALFRLPSREEAEKAKKERKKNRLSRFEEVIPEDETDAEETHDDGNDPADRGDGSAAD